MGTRGLYGIRKNGIDKATYNHWDSYPDGLGKSIVKFCANNDMENLNKFFDSIELVREDSIPTNEQIEYCVASGHANVSVSNQSVTDWYCLVRNLQGDFAKYQNLIDNDSKIYMIDRIDFIRDSLFCEYAYIINLDDNVLEFYMGMQYGPQEGNRYGEEAFEMETLAGDYYPCKLLMSFPLENLNDVGQVVATMNAIVKEEYDKE